MMMNCKQCIDFLTDYLDGTLPEGQRMVFERHLEACPPCLDYVRSYRQTVEASKCACSCQKNPGEVPEALVNAILAALKQK